MEKIKAVREALNLKQNEFAERLNITQSYLSAMETGRKEVSIKVIKALIAAFNVSPEWYYNNNGTIFNSSMGNINGVNDGENTSEIHERTKAALNKNIEDLKNKITKRASNLNASDVDQVDLFLNASILRENYEDFSFKFYDYLKAKNPELYKTVSEIKHLPAIERALSKINNEFSFLHNPFFHFAYQGKKDITYKEYQDFMMDNLSKSELRLQSLDSLIKALVKVQEHLEKGL